MNLIKSTNLYYKEGSSDKVYRIALNEHVEGFTVDFEYGRRGNSLAKGSKTPSPTTLDKATTIYGKLLTEKLGKGYVEDSTGVPFSGNFKWHVSLQKQL